MRKITSNEVEALLTEKEVAGALNLKVSTLQRWRWDGSGPPYVKLGAAVRYRRSDILAFVEANERNSTSDAGSKP